MIMKNNLVLLFATVFILSSTLKAQSTDEDFKVGVKAGWHYANLYRNGDANYGELNSFYVGFFSEMQTSSKVKVGSAIEYFQNGFDNSDGKFLLHTISLPGYSKVFVGPAFAIVGLGLNFRIVDNREDFPGGQQTQTKVTATKLLDLPVSLGLGIELGRFIVEAKYSWGLFNAAYIDGGAHKNRYLQVGGALTFLKQLHLARWFVSASHAPFRVW